LRGVVLPLTACSEALHNGCAKCWDSTRECTDAGTNDADPCRVQCHAGILPAATGTRRADARQISRLV
jgi:hypothetical protein